MFRLRTFILAILVGGLAGRPARGAEGNELVGFVRVGDISSGAGVPGATVCVDTLGKCVEADARGFYRFAGLGGGVLQVRLAEPGYQETVCSRALTESRTWCSMATRRGGGPASARFARSPPSEQYAMVRTALGSIFTPEHDRRVGPSAGALGLVYDLNDCYSGAEHVPDDAAPVVQAYAQLGYRAMALRRYLPKLGYPESLWKPVADGYERDGLARLLATNGEDVPYVPDAEGGPEIPGTGLTADALGPTFAAYRRGHQGVGMVVMHGTCGDALEQLAIRTDPPGGRILLIPLFFYDLCRAQGLDPEDSARCDYWKEPVNGRFHEVAGAYHYRIAWPDGRTTAGQLRDTEYFGEAEVVLQRR